MKKIFIGALLCAVPALSYAQDARMTYKKVNGDYAQVAPVSSVCSVDADGVPQLCADGIAGASAAGPGLFTYKTPDGKTANVQPVVPVCSLTSTGIPEICDFSSSSSSVISGLVVGDAQAVTANGTWPTTDPLTAGQAWSSGGVMMLSTGSAAKPTFDGSGLANVATLNSSGQVTAPIYSNSAAQTGALQVNGQINAQGIGYFVSSMAQIQGIISGSSKKWTLTRRDQDTYTKLNNYTGSSWTAFTFNDDGTLDSNLGVFANLGADAPFTGTVSAATLSASKSAFVPDTSTTDLTTAALNTESAAARFVAKADESSFATDTDLAKYAPLASPALTGTPTAPTPAAGDNSTNVATTAFVNTAVQGASGSVTGNLSASGSSLSMPVGSSGLTLTMSYVSSGTGSLSIVSTNGTITPVDIYETAAWGTTAMKGYVLDSGTITTTSTLVDGTFYLSSNAWGTYHIRAGGSLFVVDVFGSGKGARTTMSWRKLN